MYNSKLKYYFKGLIGRKNDMWYFDSLVRSYPYDIQRQIKELLVAYNTRPENTIELLSDGYSYNPYYEPSEMYRTDILSSYRNKYQFANIKFFIHLPPPMLSIGGYSFLSNLSIALKHTGINVEFFWNDFKPTSFSEKNILLGIGSEHLTSNLNWSIIAEAKKKYNLYVGLQCCPDISNATKIEKYIDTYLNYGVNFFYSFNNHQYVINSSGLADLATRKGFYITSIEFSANPLIHYAPKYIKPDYDYIFIGSSNHDKIKRYYSFFKKIFKTRKGLVIGPGWDWTKDIDFNSNRDLFFYSQSKVGLNLHLDFQIEAPREINERTFILAALGLPQIIDHPKLLKYYFSSVGMVANDPEEYVFNLALALDQPEITKSCIESSMRELYEKHTTFHRVDKLISEINNF